MRKNTAGALLDALREWLQVILSRTAQKSQLALAIGYSLTRWTALIRYRDSGSIEIDNNAAERMLRAVALGRKNYLFCGADADADGDRAAAIYSLLGTANLNGLGPETYLRYVIDRVADHSISRVDEFLPWAIADSLPQDLPLAAGLIPAPARRCCVDAQAQTQTPLLSRPPVQTQTPLDNARHCRRQVHRLLYPGSLPQTSEVR